jgi:hypothetical protein
MTPIEKAYELIGLMWNELVCYHDTEWESAKYCALIMVAQIMKESDENVKWEDAVYWKENNTFWLSVRDEINKAEYGTNLHRKSVHKGGRSGKRKKTT